MHLCRLAGAGLVASGFAIWPAAASDLVYTPVNPSFGGSPLNSSHLLGTANAQNRFEKKSNTPTPTLAEQFAKQLQSRLYSALASQITDAIFGENAQEEGRVQFEDQTIEWSRGLESIIVKITNETTGAETVIEVPLNVDVIF
jgi:curli production assembly/transport component CsgF